MSGEIRLNKTINGFDGLYISFTDGKTHAQREFYFLSSQDEPFARNF